MRLKRGILILFTSIFIITTTSCRVSIGFMDKNKKDNITYDDNYDNECGEYFKYRELSNQTLIITGLSKSFLPEELKIPNTHDGKKVVGIEENIISHQENIKKVIIPPNIKNIGFSCFSECSSLESVKFNNGLESMASGAFKDCENLKEVELPDSILEIGQGIFQGCSSLEKISFPSQLSIIPYNCCCDCTKLKEVTINNGTICIESNSFTNCESLKELYIPDSVNDLSEIFDDSTNDINCTLKCEVKEDKIHSEKNWYKKFNKGNNGKVEFDQKIEDKKEYKTYEDKKNNLVYGQLYDDTLQVIAFAGNKKTEYSKIDELKIPDEFEGHKITYISPSISRYASSVKNLVLSNNIKRIGSGVFERQNKIILNEGLEYIGDRAFSFADIEEIKLPSTLLEIGDGAFSFCKKLKKVEIPSSIRIIPRECFSQCEQLSEVIINDGVKAIEEGAFSDCINLKELFIPKSVENLDSIFFASSNINCTILCEKDEKDIKEKIDKYESDRESDRDGWSPDFNKDNKGQVLYNKKREDLGKNQNNNNQTPQNETIDNKPPTETDNNNTQDNKTDTDKEKNEKFKEDGNDSYI